MQEYMDIAYDYALKATKKGDVPVGAVIVLDNKVIAKAYNNRHSSNNVLGHAEIVAISKAQKKLKTWHLNDCEMYVTLEPCDMCKAIILESRMKKIYFLANKADQKLNFCSKNDTKFEFLHSNYYKKYSSLLSSFFDNKR